jgi:hypothetical protein
VLQSRILEFFARREIRPTNELLPSDARVRERAGQFEFTLSPDPKANAELIRALFTDIFGVDDSCELEFRTEGI